MKQIITIQHTQSIHHTNGMVGSWTDWDLSELGIEQAERIGQKLAKQLSGHKIVMYASDLLRAKHTAEIVAKHMGIKPNIRTELRERNLGKCVGKSVQWLRENIEVQEKTIDDRMFSDAESRRDEWKDSKRDRRCDRSGTSFHLLPHFQDMLLEALDVTLMAYFLHTLLLHPSILAGMKTGHKRSRPISS